MSTLSDALDAVERMVRTYCVLPSEDHYVAATLWVAATHLSEHWTCQPRLIIKAPSKGCGKTRLGEVITEMSQNGDELAVPTPAVLYRMIDAAWDGGSPPTLFFDEVQEIWRQYRKGSESAGQLFACMKAGFASGSQVPRCVGNTNKVELFRASCMMVLAGIGDMPDEIESRGVVVRIRKLTAGESVKPFREQDKPALHAVRTALSEALKGMELVNPEVPVFDRPADVWEPLLTVAAMADKEWTLRAKLACLRLTEEYREDDDDRSRVVTLLRDIRTAFQTANADALHSQALCDMLRANDEAPWGDWNYKSAQLAHDLKQFSIKSTGIKINGTNRNGYRLAQFADAFKRYLVDEVESTENVGSTSETLAA
jgi:hypothetical protein